MSFGAWKIIGGICSVVGAGVSIIASIASGKVLDHTIETKVKEITNK